MYLLKNAQFVTFEPLKYADFLILPAAFPKVTKDRSDSKTTLINYFKKLPPGKFFEKITFLLNP